jgi:hypothetical protein
MFRHDDGQNRKFCWVITLADPWVFYFLYATDEQNMAREPPEVLNFTMQHII